MQDRGELWVFGKQKQEGGEEKGWDTDTHTEINEQCGDDRINLWDFPDTNALFFNLLALFVCMRGDSSYKPEVES